MDNEIQKNKIPDNQNHIKYRGVTCLNCQHPLAISDKYCPNCSQLNSLKKLSLKDYLLEFLSTLFSYDTKLFKTLAALLLKPGKITTDYIAGKRVSYTNPFKFLLSLAIIYFLLMGLGGDFEKLNRFGEDNKDGFTNLDSSIIETIDFGEANEDKKELMHQLDSLQLGKTINKHLKKRDSIILSNPTKELKTNTTDSYISRHFKKQEAFSTLIKNDTLYNFMEAVDRYDLKNTFSNKLAFNTAKSILKARKEPGALINALLSKLPFTTFFFLPVFTIFIWLMYIRKKYTYTDHLIFSFHNQSLLFILLIISYLIDVVFNIESSGVFILIFAIYLYKAMRTFYTQGRFKTIVKYSILNTVFIILASIGGILLLAGSIFTY